MAKPQVNITFGNGNLLQDIVVQDGIMGLILTVNTAGLQGIPVKVNSLNDALSKGFTQAAEPSAYRHLQEFYNELGGNMDLWLLPVAAASTMAQIINPANTVGATALLKAAYAANESVRVLGITRTPGSGYDAGEDFLDDDVQAAVTATSALGDWALANWMPCRFVIEGRVANKTAANTYNPSEAGVNYTGVLLGGSQNDATVNSILSYNEGSQERQTLLDSLFAKYPDLFSNLNKETVTNNQLEQALRGVNDQYSRMISLASNQLIADTTGKKAQEAWSEYVRLKAIGDAYASGNTELAESLEESGEHQYLSTNKQASQHFLYRAGKYLDIYNSNEKLSKNASYAADIQKSSDDWSKWAAPYVDDNTLSKAVGKENFSEAQHIYRWLAAHAGNKDPFIQSLFVSNTKRFNSLLNPSAGASAGMGGTGGGEGGDDGTGAGTGKGSRTADGITGGGPRVININGVKFADKIEIVHSDYERGEAELEARLHDMLMRLLYSGASVQG